jgi:hypothetical protein
MVNVEFKVDDKFLLYYLVSNFNKERFIDGKEIFKNDIKNFQEQAWIKSKTFYRLIDGRASLTRRLILETPNHEHTIHDLFNYIDELINSDKFKILKQQTLETVSLVLSEWEDNYEMCWQYLEDIGIKVEGNFTVYLVHPGLKAGSFMGDNKVCWSYQDKWQNYNTVYVWHEILHSNFGNTDKEHALIELITDEEMRVLLNGGEYPPYVGHPFLNDHKDKLLGKWKNHLNSQSKNINLILE